MAKNQNFKRNDSVLSRALLIGMISGSVLSFLFFRLTADENQVSPATGLSSLLIETEASSLRGNVILLHSMHTNSLADSIEHLERIVDLEIILLNSQLSQTNSIDSVTRDLLLDTLRFVRIYRDRFPRKRDADDNSTEFDDENVRKARRILTEMK